MREQKWCQTELRKWAIFRSLGKTYYILHSTRRKCPPISGGFEANLGMETASCTRWLQKLFFGNVLPTEGGEHIFITFAKKWRKNMPISIKNQSNTIYLKRWQKRKANNECKPGFNRKSGHDTDGSNIGIGGWVPGGGGPRLKMHPKVIRIWDL